jgi:hypothetical protein
MSFIDTSVGKSYDRRTSEAGETIPQIYATTYWRAIVIKKMSVITAISFLSFLLCGTVSAQETSSAGLSVGVGLGTMVAIDKESYFDSGIDFYPEAVVAYDKEALSAEASLGLLYKKATVKTTLGNLVLSKTDVTQAFLPLELTVKYRPLQKNNPDSLFHPYLGLGAGWLIPTGDNDQGFFVLSPDCGISMGSKHVLELDCAYKLVLGEDDLAQGDNLDYLKVTLRYKYRFAFN